MKDIAPSTELRKWYNHEPNKFEEFKQMYKKEVNLHEKEISKLLKYAQESDLVLLYGAKDKVYNQAIVLKQILDELMDN
jgi:uncharacterized protein YeaO (DUF488 family)